MRKIAKHVIAAAVFAGVTGAVQAGGLVVSFVQPFEVNAISPTQFEVIERGDAGAQDMWCEAARYAGVQLGMTRGRLYIETPRGPARTAQGRIGVTFTTDVPAKSVTSYSVNVRQAGLSLPIFHARQFCRNHIIEPDDL